MKDTEHNKDLPFNTVADAMRAQTHKPPSLEIDYARYQHYLDDEDLSDAEKQAFIEALWSIVLNFVDLGIGVHPLQKVCGQNAQSCGNGAVEGEFGVESPMKSLEHEFDEAVRYLPEPAENPEVT